MGNITNKRFLLGPMTALLQPILLLGKEEKWTTKAALCMLQPNLRNEDVTLIRNPIHRPNIVDSQVQQGPT